MTTFNKRRVAATVALLTALPPRTIVTDDDGHVWQKSYSCWGAVGDDQAYSSGVFASLTNEITVLKVGVE